MSSLMRSWCLGVVGLILVQIFGCAAPTKIRVSDGMFQENRARKVAILASGKVDYPRPRNEGNSLHVGESKAAVGVLLAQAKEELTKKGYEVVFAEPIGFGFHCAGWWLLDSPGAPPASAVAPRGTEPAATDPAPPPEPGAKPETDAVRIPEAKITGEAPVCEGEVLARDEKFRAAAKHLMWSLEDALAHRQLGSFQPDPSDVATIQEFTGADTICVQRVYGRKYTATRKAADFALGFAVAMLGGYKASATTEIVESFFLFVEPPTDTVLWQHGFATTGDPLSPSESFVADALKYFPAQGQPLDSTICSQKATGLAECKD